MSGIAGLMTTNGEAAPGPVLRAMAETLKHRGPDGDGHYRSGDVGMVHTRLAIIDLATGDQPFYEPGGAALVANAEIYNHEELRGEFPAAVFATQSDCELPLHLYRRQGLDFTCRLRGMYALAVHDPAAGRLVLARDPFGIKPLYYAETARHFAFASEPEALLQAGIVERRVAVSARSELLQMQFTTGRDTIFAGIQRVLPGETIVARQGRIVERRRRDALPTGEPNVMEEEAALVRLEHVLGDSIRHHLRADVPVGLLLSGSAESIALLVMLARHAAHPLKTYTATFAGNGSANERAAAKAVGAEPVNVAFEEGDFWRLLPEVAAVIDDPAADYAMLPACKFAAVARADGFKVVLSAEGGDELFAGYGRYRSVMRPWWAGGRAPRVRGFLDDLGILRGEMTGWRDGIAAAESLATGGGRTRLQIAQAVDCADWLPNDLLVKLDRCLMAHSIEGRAPFLDPEMALFAFRLPDALKIQRGFGKWLVRRWLARELPLSQPLARRRAVTMPVGRWIAARAAEIGPLVARSDAVRALCDPEGVERVFAAAAQKRAGRAAWTLLFYALWHRRHIEGRDLPPDTLAALAGG